MTHKKATKNYYQLEKEEIERLVRKSPEKKPPRTDKERGRIQVPDKDLEATDPDLSMNYKDIGGSLAKKIAQRYLKSFEFLEDMEEDEDEYYDEDEETEEDEEGEEEEEPEPVEEIYLRPPTDLQILNKALELYFEPVTHLQSLINEDSLTKAEREAVYLAFQLKVHPLPPKWEKSEVFLEGNITLKARRILRKHMSNWDIKNFADNLNYFREKFINDSLVIGTDEVNRYYEVLIELVQQEYDEILGKRLPPLTIESALETMEKSDQEFSSKDKKKLDKEFINWLNRLKFTNLETCEQMLGNLQDKIEETDKKTSVRYAWLSTLKTLIEGCITMKKVPVVSMSESQKVASVLKTSIKTSCKHMKKLTAVDYAAIIMEAFEYLKRPDIAYSFLYQPEMAYRIALDMSIKMMDESRYAGRIDAPTYERLVRIMSRI